MAIADYNTLVTPRVGPIYSGDTMSRAEFHERYLRCADMPKVELVEGVVYVASPTSFDHGNSQGLVVTLLGNFSIATPGVQVCVDATVMVGPNDEPRPDGLLRIAPEYGGQSRTVREKDAHYIEDPPEFIAEVAYSSHALDLFAKRRAYQSLGILEYLVVCIEESLVR